MYNFWAIARSSPTMILVRLNGERHSFSFSIVAPALPFAGWELLHGPLVTRLAQGGPVAPRFRPFRQRPTTKFQSRRGAPLRRRSNCDLYAYHILAYDEMRLVGCVRIYPLISNDFSCITEQILGEKTFSELLDKLGSRRTETIEIGRWIVHPAYRAWSPRRAIGCGFCSSRNSA